VNGKPVRLTALRRLAPGRGGLRLPGWRRADLLVREADGAIVAWIVNRRPVAWEALADPLRRAVARDARRSADPRAGRSGPLHPALPAPPAPAAAPPPWPAPVLPPGESPSAPDR
jgi:hypothetical protein